MRSEERAVQSPTLAELVSIDCRSGSSRNSLFPKLVFEHFFGIHDLLSKHFHTTLHEKIHIALTTQFSNSDIA